MASPIPQLLSEWGASINVVWCLGGIDSFTSHGLPSYPSSCFSSLKQPLLSLQQPFLVSSSSTHSQFLPFLLTSPSISWSDTVNAQVLVHSFYKQTRREWWRGYSLGITTLATPRIGLSEWCIATRVELNSALLRTRAICPAKQTVVNRIMSSIPIWSIITIYFTLVTSTSNQEKTFFCMKCPVCLQIKGATFKIQKCAMATLGASRPWSSSFLFLLCCLFNCAVSSMVQQFVLLCKPWRTNEEVWMLLKFKQWISFRKAPSVFSWTSRICQHNKVDLVSFSPACYQKPFES